MRATAARGSWRPARAILHSLPLVAVIVSLTALVGPRPPALQAAGPGPQLHFPLALGAATQGPAGPYYQGELGYGLSTAHNHCDGRVRELGFGYVKFYVRWADYEPQKGAYAWATGAADTLRQAVQDGVRQGVRVLIRVDTPPAWAAPGSGNRPPTNPADYGEFMGALARYLKGWVAAYELWNEPNLSYEWGNAPPDPERYTALLRAAYPQIKAADGRVVVVTAGLASTGGDGGAMALNDVEFIERMYQAGARGFFDALGSHPYGFANPPETRNANNVTDFQRAADQHQVMERYGDGAKKVWATEFGWIVDPASYGHPEYLSDPLWAGRAWQRVDPQAQAAYLVRAYQYAYANWPWMGVMLVFNLDFSTVPWYPPAEPMRWYAIVNPDGSPRPAYQALAAMAKPTRR